MSLLADTMAAIQPQDDAWRARATARIEGLAMPIVDAARGILVEMATFDAAAVSEASQTPA